MAQDKPDQAVISELHFEWGTGHNPDVTFAEYLVNNTGLKHDDVTWRTVSREIQMMREFIENITYKEALEMTEEELSEYDL